eukprot:comp16617_c0_seq1/m.14780 comp16617_c0_seq1/g.14780  ORF comp16617_c0_seq1/g.14780 comp16617_c0_seq1/m.14780 type:complete len:199 (-) comp16617_c0_seq1:254-850(-)
MDQAAQQMAAAQAAAAAQMNPQAIQNQQAAQLHHFWQQTLNDIRQGSNFKEQILPLARIKKIMKMDDDVKMISQEALVLFAKALEIFICELSLRAWSHTEENKRRTMQRNDIAMAVSRCDTFDFLIDIVPRDDLKATRRPDEDIRPMVMPPDQMYYYQYGGAAGFPGMQMQGAGAGMPAADFQQQQLLGQYGQQGYGM